MHSKYKRKPDPVRRDQQRENGRVQPGSSRAQQHRRRGLAVAAALCCATSLLTGCGGAKDPNNGAKLHAMQPGTCNTRVDHSPAEWSYWSEALAARDGQGTPPNVVSGTAVMTQQDDMINFCLSNFSVTPPVDVIVSLLPRASTTLGIVEYVITRKQLASGTSFIAKQIKGLKDVAGSALVYPRSKNVSELAVTSGGDSHFPS